MLTTAFFTALGTIVILVGVVALFLIGDAVVYTYDKIMGKPQRVFFR